MTRTDDPRLRGQWPEFARMSLKPGIGYSGLHEIASQLMTFDLETTQSDVPVTLRVGAQSMPLGRYLVQNLRALVGKEKNAPQSVLDEVASKVLPLRLAARGSEENPSLKNHLLSAGSNKAGSMVKRARMFKQRKQL